MSLSILDLREAFRTHLEKWEEAFREQPEPSLITPEIEQFAENIERSIQTKIKLLESDFNNLTLEDEYARSINEGFSNLEQMQKTNKTCMDAAKGQDIQNILSHMKQHYKNYIVPIFNVMAKLENDFQAITIKSILEKRKRLTDLDFEIKAFKDEKNRIRKRFFDLNRKKKYWVVSKKLKQLELEKTLTHLTLHHDKLNLYYINHNRPQELHDIKARADALRSELSALEEKEYGQ